MPWPPFAAQAQASRILAKFDDVLSPSANGRDGNHVPTSRQGAGLKGGSMGKPDDWLGIYSRVSGLGGRVSGTGYQVRVRVRALNLHQVLNP